MMSSAAWSAPYPIAPVGSHPLPIVPVSGQPCGATVLSHTIAACPYVLQVMMTLHVCMSSSASVTCGRTMVTREPSCMPRVAKPFFIPVVHNPLGAWDTCQHRSSLPQGGRARSHGTHGSAGAHLGREVRSRAEGHVVVPELTSARR
jgi:hypothetical protein